MLKENVMIITSALAVLAAALALMPCLVSAGPPARAMGDIRVRRIVPEQPSR